MGSGQRPQEGKGEVSSVPANVSTGRNSAQDRCTASDYRQLFSSSSDDLYRLCFMLTADEEIARASFATAREHMLKHGSHVFREWMRSWARRQMIKACIGTLRTEIQRDARSVRAAHTADLALLAGDKPCVLPSSTAETFQRSLLKLDVLPRFVLVLRSLEWYSARETALLLDIDIATTALAHKAAIEAVRIDTGRLSPGHERTEWKPVGGRNMNV